MGSQEQHMRCADASTVGYARMNVTGSRTSFVIASVCSSTQWNICI